MSRKEAGFTLVELIFTVAILAVLLVAGVPAFFDVLQRMRANATLHLLSADMAMARSTAVMRHAPVVICPRDDAGGCATATDWSRGWMVFNDPDGNRIPGGNEDILRVTDPPGSGRLFLPASRRVLRYQPDGRSANANLTVYVCSNDRYRGKVVVNNLGRVRTERAVDDGAACPKG